MIKIFKPYNSKSIANNLDLVFRTKDIKKLNGTTYNFLYLMSGFIAHYNIFGFRDYYSEVEDLAKDINRSNDSYRPEYWITSHFVEQYGIEYCQSKTDTIEAINEVVKKYFINLN